MAKEPEIKYIEFSEEAKATFGAAMQKIVDAIYSTPKNTSSIQPSALDQQQQTVQRQETQRFYTKCFTTLTDFTKDDLVVSEIDGGLLNNIAELNLLPCQSRNEKLELHTKKKNKLHNKKTHSLVNKTNTLTSPKKPRKNSSGSVYWESKQMLKLKRKTDCQYIRCICPECSIELSDFFAWKAHVCDVHNYHKVKSFTLISYNSNVGNYTCNECHQLIKAPNITSEKLLYHRVSHSENPICFECRFCRWRHHNAVTLMRHVRVHHMPKNKSKKHKPNA